MNIRPSVILLAGPAGSGKSTTAARIAEQPRWIHISEDDHWVRVKACRPAGEDRTAEEEDVVQQQVTERLLNELAGENKVVLEFILYEDPPRPLLRYQEALAANGVTYVTRILRPSADEILQRIALRRRPNDMHHPALRDNAEHQVGVLAPPYILDEWVIDSTDLSIDALHTTHFAPLLG